MYPNYYQLPKTKRRKLSQSHNYSFNAIYQKQNDQRKKKVKRNSVSYLKKHQDNNIKIINQWLERAKCWISLNQQTQTKYLDKSHNLQRTNQKIQNKISKIELRLTQFHVQKTTIIKKRMLQSLYDVSQSLCQNLSASFIQAFDQDELINETPSIASNIAASLSTNITPSIATNITPSIPSNIAASLSTNITPSINLLQISHTINSFKYHTINCCVIIHKYHTINSYKYHTINSFKYCCKYHTINPQISHHQFLQILLLTNITPSIPSNIAASLSTNITPSIATNITPSIPSNIAASLSTNITPSIATNITPSIPSNIAASLSTNITPSIATNITPSIPSNIAASLSTNITPSIPSNIAASLSTNITPSIPSNITASLSTNITPSIPSNIAASLSTNITPSIPSNIKVSLPINTELLPYLVKQKLPHIDVKISQETILAISSALSSKVNNNNNNNNNVKIRKIICKNCNIPFKYTLAKNAYKCSSTIQILVICGLCHKDCKPDEYVYHCPNGFMQTGGHPHGYDVCVCCAHSNHFSTIDYETDCSQEDDDDYHYEQIVLKNDDNANKRCSNVSPYQCSNACLFSATTFWTSKVKELKKSESSEVLKKKYPHCGTCAGSFGNEVSSPLQCAYQIVQRCQDAVGYHHYGSFMANTNPSELCCFFCHLYIYLSKGNKSLNYQNLAVFKQCDVKCSNYYMNDTIDIQPNKYYDNLPESDKYYDLGDVYFVHTDVTQKTHIAFIYIESSKIWYWRDWKNIKSEKHFKQMRLYLNGIRRCNSPGWTEVNIQTLTHGERLSIIRIGNLHSGGFLIRDYFSIQEESDIVNGHKLCIMYKKVINQHFNALISRNNNPQTVEVLKYKSTVWILIIILYHAVSSPQLHKTNFGRDRYYVKLKQIIQNEQHVLSIIKYIDTLFYVFGKKYQKLCKQIGIDYNPFIAYQTQFYYKNPLHAMAKRLTGHRDTWKLGDRGFVAGTFMHSSIIKFTDRFNQRVTFKLNKPVRSLLIVMPRSFLATKVKHHIDPNPNESLTALARCQATNYSLEMEMNRRKRKNNPLY